MKKLPLALGMAVIFALAGCSSSSSGGNPGTTPPPTTPATNATPAPVATGAAGIALATKELKANWAIFFSSATPHSQAVSLLQNGANLGPAVRFAAKLAKSEKLKEAARVKTITFSADGMSASLTYNLYGNKKGTATGTPLIKGGDGFAVLDSGVWKVTQRTFCQLVDLGAGSTKVPGC